MLQTRSAIPFDVKSDGDGSTFEGKASVYGVLDSYNEIVAPGAFSKTVDAFLQRGKILSQHRTLIGKPTMCKEAASCLLVGGKISDTAEGRDTKTLLKDGVVSSLSIGFRTLSSTYLEGPKQVEDYWKSIGYSPSMDEMGRSKYGARVLNEIDLLEVSLVSFPANPACDVTSVKSVADFLALSRHDLQHSGLVVERLKGAKLTDDQKAKIQGHVDLLRGHCAMLSACADDMGAMLCEPTDPELEKSRVITLKAKLSLYRP